MPESPVKPDTRETKLELNRVCLNNRVLPIVLLCPNYRVLPYVTSKMHRPLSGVYPESAFPIAISDTIPQMVRKGVAFIEPFFWLLPGWRFEPFSPGASADLVTVSACPNEGTDQGRTNPKRMPEFRADLVGRRQ